MGEVSNEQQIKKLSKTIDELTDKLVLAHKNMQKEIEQETEKIKEKLEKEKNETIKKLEHELLKEKIEKDNFKSEKDKYKKILKKVKDTAKIEIQKAMAVKASEFDFTEEILNLCTDIEKEIGGSLFQLSSLCSSLDNIDYISQQRIQSLLRHLNMMLKNIEISTNMQISSDAPSSIDSLNYKIDDANDELEKQYNENDNEEQLNLSFDFIEE